MSFSFRPATRENVALLLGYIGASGGGKTYTAMETATGIMDVLAPGKPFAVIDTEAGRCTWNRVTYDVPAVQAAMTAEALPPRLIARLSHGV